MNKIYVSSRYAYGFERPSAVQQRAILPILKGRDVPSVKSFFSAELNVKYDVVYVQCGIAVWYKFEIQLGTR